MERGLAIEQMLANFVSIFFLNDFIYKDVRFVSSGVTKAHPADLLFVLGDECIVVSVKGTDGVPKSPEKLLLWLTKKAKDGNQAAKVGIQRLDIPFSAVNLWGERKQFAAGSLKAICGISVLECSQEPHREISFPVEPLKCTHPIHLMSMNDLLNLSFMLGSIWDLFHYFREKASLQQFPEGINLEKPLLAHYLLQAKDFKSYDPAKKDLLVTRLQLLMMDRRSDFAQRNEYVHRVNSIARELHTRDAQMESFVPPEFVSAIEPEANRKSHLVMAAILNNLPTSQKAFIGKRITELLGDLKGSGYSGCLGHLSRSGGPLLVFAVFSGDSRTNRIRKLHDLAKAAQLHHQQKEVLGIGMDANQDDSPFDLVWMRGEPVSTPELQQLADLVFRGTEQMKNADPFGVARPYEVS